MCQTTIVQPEPLEKGDFPMATYHTIRGQILARVPGIDPTDIPGLLQMLVSYGERSRAVGHGAGQACAGWIRDVMGRGNRRTAGGHHRAAARRSRPWLERARGRGRGHGVDTARIHARGDPKTVAVMRYAPPPIEIRANRTLELPKDERASTPRLSCVPAGGGIYSGSIVNSMPCTGVGGTAWYERCPSWRSMWSAYAPTRRCP